MSAGGSGNDRLPDAALTIPAVLAEPPLALPP
jgi:hypothetical protein